jgi:hypothetical protein
VACQALCMNLTSSRPGCRRSVGGAVPNGSGRCPVAGDPVAVP